MTTDVNEVFAMEQRSVLTREADRLAAFQARVISGKLVPAGGSRYRVNDPGSWDNGEIWVQPQANTPALPQHGLALDELGQARLYSAVPAWHELGTVIPGGISDIDEVLRLGGIDDFIEKRAVRYSFGGTLHEMPEHFVTVNSRTGQGYGVVGSVYEPIQNADGASFLHELVADGQVVFQSAGALRDGQKVFISLEIPEGITVDAAGINENVRLYLAWLNSFDGSTALQVVVTPWRPLCGNTERFARRDAVSRWAVRHTRNALADVDEARRTLGLTLKYAEKFAAEETALAQTEMTIDGVRALITTLWPEEDGPARQSQRSRTMAANRDSALMALWDLESGRCGPTAYAAERMVTGYLDNGKARKTSAFGGSSLAARATAVLEGTDDALKSKAHERLMLLTRR